LDIGVPFDKFQDKIKNYVLKNFKKAEDIIKLIIELKNPTILFESKHMLADLTDEKKEKPAKIKMWESRLKKFRPRRNIIRKYASLIWNHHQAVYTIAPINHQGRQQL